MNTDTKEEANVTAGQNDPGSELKSSVLTEKGSYGGERNTIYGNGESHPVFYILALIVIAIFLFFYYL